MLNTGTNPHSIKAIAFVCEFDREVSPAGLELVVTEHKRFRKRLILREPMRNLEFQLQGSAKLLQKDNIAGYRFSSKAPDNSDTVWYEIANNRAVFCLTDYVNFATFSGEVFYYIGLAIKAFSKGGATLTRTTLEYRDEFLSDVIDWPPYETLRENTDYIAKAAITQGKLWHSHIGFYTDSEYGTLLNQARVEHERIGNEQDDNIEYRLAITLTHILSESPLYAAMTDEISDTLSSLLNALHDHHKFLFRKLITEEQAVAIGLKPEAEANS